MYGDVSTSTEAERHVGRLSKSLLRARPTKETESVCLSRASATLFFFSLPLFLFPQTLPSTEAVGFGKTHAVGTKGKFSLAKVVFVARNRQTQQKVCALVFTVDCFCSPLRKKKKNRAPFRKRSDPLFGVLFSLDRTSIEKRGKEEKEKGEKKKRAEGENVGH